MALIEFKDLPDTTAPITAENLNKIQESNIYSTDEIEVGKWIDGKPIYRKLVLNDTITNSNRTITIPNMDKLLFIKFRAIKLSNGNENQVFANTYYDSNNDKLTISYFLQNNLLSIWTATGDSYNAQVFFEYTKTTD